MYSCSILLLLLACIPFSLEINVHLGQTIDFSSQLDVRQGILAAFDESTLIYPLLPKFILHTLDDHGNASLAIHNLGNLTRGHDIIALIGSGSTEESTEHLIAHHDARATNTCFVSPNFVVRDEMYHPNVWFTRATHHQESLALVRLLIQLEEMANMGLAAPILHESVKVFALLYEATLPSFRTQARAALGLAGFRPVKELSYTKGTLAAQARDLHTQFAVYKPHAIFISGTNATEILAFIEAGHDITTNAVYVLGSHTLPGMRDAVARIPANSTLLTEPIFAVHGTLPVPASQHTQFAAIHRHMNTSLARLGFSDAERHALLESPLAMEGYLAGRFFVELYARFFDGTNLLKASDILDHLSGVSFSTDLDGFLLGPYRRSCDAGLFGDTQSGRCPCQAGVHELWITPLNLTRGADLLFPIVRRVKTHHMHYPFCNASLVTLASVDLPYCVLFGQTACFAGALEEFGRAYRLGIASAFYRHNSIEATDPFRLLLVYLDDRYEAEQAGINALRLIDDYHAFALIGSVGTPTAHAILEVTKNVSATRGEHYPLIAPATGAQFLRSETLAINLRSSYNDEAAALVQFFIDNQLSRVGVFYVENSYGIDGHEGVRVALEAYGLHVVGTGKFAANNLSQIPAAADAIMAREPEAVIMIAVQEPTRRFIAEARKRQCNVVLAGFSIAGLESLVVELTLNERQGLYFSQVVPIPFGEATSHPQYSRDLIGNFSEAVHRIEPGANLSFPALEGYIAGRFISQVLERIPEDSAITREGLLRVLYSTGLFTVNGLAVGPYADKAYAFGGPSAPCHQGIHAVFISEINAKGEFELAQSVHVGRCGDPKVFRPIGSDQARNLIRYADSCRVMPTNEHPIYFAQSGCFAGSENSPHFFGTEMRRGIHAAWQYAWNHGRDRYNITRRLVLVNKNDDYEPAKTVDNTQSFLDRYPIAALIGYVGTPPGRAGYDYLTQGQPHTAGVPYIGAATGLRELRYPKNPEDRRRIVNVRASFDDEIVQMINYCVNQLGKRRVAIFYQNDAYGQEIYNALNLAMAFFSERVIANGTYERNSGDVRRGLHQIIDQSLHPVDPSIAPGCPDVILAAAVAHPLAEFVFEARNQTRCDMRDTVFLSNSFGEIETFVELLRTKHTNAPAPAQQNSFPASWNMNVLLSLAVPLPSESPTYLAALEQFFPGQAPTITGLEGFMTGMLVVRALQRIDNVYNVTHEGLLDALYSGQFGIDGIPLGPYGAKCNQGMKSVSIVNITAEGTLQLVAKKSVDQGVDQCTAYDKFHNIQCSRGMMAITTTRSATVRTACAPCPPGEYSATGEDCRVCPVGSHQPNLRQGACLACPLHTYSDHVRSPTCTPCAANAETSGTSAMRREECMCIGQYYGPGWRQCSPCPRGGECCNTTRCRYGTLMPRAAKGYFYSPLDTNKFILCYPAEACLGGFGYDAVTVNATTNVTRCTTVTQYCNATHCFPSRASFAASALNLTQVNSTHCTSETLTPASTPPVITHDICGGNFTGYACAFCKYDYARFGNECVKCPSPAGQAFRVVGLLVFYVAILFYLMINMMHYRVSGLVRILVFFFQYLSAFIFVKVPWPHSVSAFLDVLSVARFGSAVFAYGCMFHEVDRASSFKQMNSMHIRAYHNSKWLVKLLILVVVFFISWAVLLISRGILKLIMSRAEKRWALRHGSTVMSDRTRSSSSYSVSVSVSVGEKTTPRRSPHRSQQQISHDSLGSSQASTSGFESKSGLGRRIERWFGLLVRKNLRETNRVMLAGSMRLFMLAYFTLLSSAFMGIYCYVNMGDGHLYVARATTLHCFHGSFLDYLPLFLGGILLIGGWLVALSICLFKIRRRRLSRKGIAQLTFRKRKRKKKHMRLQQRRKMGSVQASDSDSAHCGISSQYADPRNDPFRDTEITLLWSICNEYRLWPQGMKNIPLDFSKRFASALPAEYWPLFETVLAILVTTSFMLGAVSPAIQLLVFALLFMLSAAFTAYVKPFRQQFLNIAHCFRDLALAALACDSTLFFFFEPGDLGYSIAQVLFFTLVALFLAYVIIHALRVLVKKCRRQRKAAVAAMQDAAIIPSPLGAPSRSASSISVAPSSLLAVTSPPGTRSTLHGQSRRFSARGSIQSDGGDTMQAARLYAS